MALINIEYRSEIMQMQMPLDVIIPDHILFEQDLQRKYPVLYLLHGLGGNQKVWHRHTMIERHLENTQLITVMPTTHKAFYTNTLNGQKYFDYVALEIPEIISKLFPVSPLREDTYVAGNSMGGYGAFKLAATYPEKFQAAIALSGVLDVAAVIHPEKYPNLFSRGTDFEMLRSVVPTGGDSNEFDFVFSTPIEGSGNDLFELFSKQIETGTPLPKMFQICGTEDFLYSVNQKFLNEFTGKLDLHYMEKSGKHDWFFWESCLPDMFAWIGR